MRAYLAIKFHSDQRNRTAIEEISTSLGVEGIETICIARDLENWGKTRFAPNLLMQKSFAIIDTCDFILVELSEKGVGIGIEAGYAYAQDIPIFTIAKTGCDISETLRGISQQVFFYNTPKNLDFIFSQLASYVEQGK